MLATIDHEPPHPPPPVPGSWSHPPVAFRPKPKVNVDNIFTAVFSAPLAGFLLVLCVGMFLVGFPLTLLALYLWEKGRRSETIVWLWRWVAWSAFAILIGIALIEFPEQTSSQILAALAVGFWVVGLFRLLRLGGPTRSAERVQ